MLLGLLLIPMFFIKVPAPFSTDPNGRLENPLEAFTQMANNWQILVATLGTLCLSYEQLLVAALGALCL